MNTKEIEFLKESNAIEREYSKEALEDAQRAWKYLNKENKLTLPIFKKVHKILIKNLDPNIAGKIRDYPVYIGGDKRAQGKKEITHNFNELIDLWHDKKEELKTKRKQDKEYFVKRWHILYELCHGWFDGNGRTGRIFMNYQRQYLGLDIHIIHEGKEQMDYYLWFKGKKTYLWKYQKEKILKEYNNGKGKTIRGMAREMKLYPQIIRNYLIRNGIKIVMRYDCNARGSKHGNWRGGIRHVKGYRHFYQPTHHLARKDGWVNESRHLAEKKIGRKLKKQEVVHHVDNNILNNKSNNLKVFKNNKEHRKFHTGSQSRNNKGQF